MIARPCFSFQMFHRGANDTSKQETTVTYSYKATNCAPFGCDRDSNADLVQKLRRIGATFWLLNSVRTAAEHVTGQSRIHLLRVLARLSLQARDKGGIAREDRDSRNARSLGAGRAEYQNRLALF